jgi:imidazolonepropionase-like amidohydrolase
METARRASAFIAVGITGMRDAWVLPILVCGQRAAHIAIHLLLAVLTFAHSLSLIGSAGDRLRVVAELLANAGRMDRLLIATDTPTGNGIMPLGMLYTISHFASLGRAEPEIAIAAATGNNARVYRLNSGILLPGRHANVVVIDACAGASMVRSGVMVVMIPLPTS